MGLQRHLAQSAYCKRAREGIASSFQDINEQEALKLLPKDMIPPSCKPPPIAKLRRLLSDKLGMSDLLGTKQEPLEQQEASELMGWLPCDLGQSDSEEEYKFEIFPKSRR